MNKTHLNRTKLFFIAAATAVTFSCKPAVEPPVTSPKPTLTVEKSPAMLKGEALRKSGVSAVFSNPETCKKFPVLDQYAKKRNLDPSLVRAVAVQESNFNQCAAAFVPVGGFNGKGYDFVPDPDGKCINGMNFVTGTAQVGGLGLMQTVEPPYTFWPANLSPTGSNGEFYDGETLNVKLFKQAPRGDLNSAKECSTYFNPFNPSHSACLGTFKLQTYLRLGEAKVKANSAILETGGDATKEMALAYYFALNHYYGTGNRIDGWINDFAAQKDMPSDGTGLIGNKDFINWVHIAKGTTNPDAEYGWKVFQNYLGLVNMCK